MHQTTLLIVDDDRSFRDLAAARLAREGWRVLEADSAALGLELLRSWPDLVLLSQRLPDAEGLVVLRRFKAASSRLPVIITAKNGTVDRAVAAMKAGASHYLTKPIGEDALAELCARALVTSGRRPSLAPDPRAPEAVLGESPAARTLREEIRRAAKDVRPVLIEGEAGSGRRLAARTLHQASSRATGPLIELACGSLTADQAELELFGVPAESDDTGRRGAVDEARHGTLLLDEITQLSPELQDRLAETLGRTPETRIVATISPPGTGLSPSLVALFAGHRVAVAPLRDRREDVRELARAFAARLQSELGRSFEPLGEHVLSWLSLQPWAGNVAELRCVVERVLLFSPQAADQTQLDGRISSAS